MSISNVAASSDEYSKTRIVREVKPCVDLRLDLRKLLDRELLCPGSFNAERHARRLLLRSDEQDLPSGDMVWLRVLPQSDRIDYEIADPMASDLEKCHRVFAIVFGFQDHVGCLNQLAAPSFSGKKAMTVIWNLIAIAQLDEMMFVDGSVQLACCTSGALTSLRHLGAFTNGKSWYEAQGATAKISKIAFRSLMFNWEEVFGFLLDNHGYRTITDTKDFDRMVFEQSSLFLQESQPSRKAYLRACHLLHSLPINKLDDGLSKLCERYPQLQGIREVLKNAPPDATTVGEFVSDCVRLGRATQEEDAHHQLLHEVRDRLVANKDSIFFQYIADRLSAHTDPDQLSCALSWCVLGSFCDALHAPKISPKKAVQIVDEIRKADTAQCQRIAHDVGPLIEPFVTSFLHGLETPRFPSGVKVLSHSTQVQREHWLRYREETGIKDEFLAPQKAIQYLARLPLNSLQRIYPELDNALEKKFQLSKERLSLDTTLGDLIDSQEKSKSEWILDELLYGAKKHVSALFVRSLDSQPSGAPEVEKIYPLFMLAKYICKARESFSLRLS